MMSDEHNEQETVESLRRQRTLKNNELDPLFAEILEGYRRDNDYVPPVDLVTRTMQLHKEVVILTERLNKLLIPAFDDEHNEQIAAAVIQDTTQEPTFLHIEDDDFTPEAIADNKGYADLRKAVHARVLAYFGPAGVPQDMIVPYGELLCEDIEKELEKFARGQREHGGDIRDRDLDAEIEPELIDARIYHRCKKLQRSYIKLNVE